MEKHSIVTLDDLHRVLVPQLVKESFGWDTNTPLTFTPNFNDGMILVSQSTEPNPVYPCGLDDHNRLTIPSDMAQKLGMEPGCTIAITPSNYSHALVLVQAAKKPA